MPESPNQDSSRQRRANWVGLRTLRQRPKAVGETAGGEPIYEVRSVRLLLDGMAPNFVRLAECTRCGRELAGAPVLTVADLDRPLRPMICTDCIRSAGVSTVWESEGGEPEVRSAPATLAASEPAPAPAPAPAEVKRPERLDAMEGHLRAVTDRVNELGRVARAHQADAKERALREEATAGALRDELAALRAATDDTRAELQRLAGAQAELARRLAERPSADSAGAGAGQLHDEVAQLARLVEAQRAEVVGFVAAVGETQAMTGELAAAQEAQAQALAGIDLTKFEELVATRLAEVDVAKIEELIGTRLAEAEGRLRHLIAGQWGDLDTAIEASVEAYMAGVLRAHEQLAGGQAGMEERVDALDAQIMQVSTRLETLLGRLDALEGAFLHAPGPRADLAPDPLHEAPARGFLDSLDRQLEAAARRLAARSQGGTGRGGQQVP